MGTKAYYGVKIGRRPGIYRSWDECLKQVKGYSNAEYKKFYDENSALEFVEEKKIITPRNGEEYETPSKGITIRYKPLIKEDIGEGEIIAYVDGSHTDGVKGFGVGVIMLAKDAEDIEISEKGLNEDFISMENVAGEIMASMMAISTAYERGYKKVYIHYDFEGVEKWATDSWTANKTCTQQYQSYVKAMAEGFIDICFIKVRAHSGIHYNEIADTLAKRAIGLS